MKKYFYGLCILLLLASCSPSENKSSQEASIGGQDSTETDVNILFIVVDDLNNTLGTYGHPTVQTPNIDKLAFMGLQFNNAYCNFAVCGPSRSSFLTGVLPETIGVVNNNTPLPTVIGDKVSLPNLFRKNGFHTMGLGKIFHRHGEGHGDAKAWDEYYDYEATELGKQGESRNMTDDVLKWCEWQAAEGEDEDQQDGQITEKAVELIKTQRDKPFFLAVGLHKPHDPFIAPKKYFDLYPLEECDPPQLPEGWTPPYPYTLPGETKTFNKFDDQDKREFLRSYYACTSFMDAQVGKLMDALKESGQMDNTLIVLFGDHGYHLGEHNWWNKVTIFEKGTNAPFIMAGNAIKEKGAKSESMFEFIDIYPTLAELFNLEGTPEYLEGKSFKNLLEDPSAPFRSEVRATTRRGEINGKMVKTKEWRYVEWNDGEKGAELYNQSEDPIEYNNLADNPEYQSVVEEMKELLNRDSE